MPLLVLLGLLLLSNWFFSEVLTILPLELFAFFRIAIRFSLWGFLLLLFIWCFGDG